MLAKTSRLFVISLLLLALLVGTVGAASTPLPETGLPADGQAASLYEPGYLVVKFTPQAARTLAQGRLTPGLAGLRDTYNVQSAEQIFPNATSATARRYRLEDIYLLTAPKSTDIWRMAADYAARSEVVYAEPDLYARGMALQGPPVEPNDPLFPDQWSLNNTGQTGGTADADVDWLEAYNFLFLNPPSQNPIIAVLDTGVDYNHPDLDDNLLSGWDFVDDDDDPYDEDGHGTKATSIAGVETDNRLGLAAACPNCPILPVRVGRWVVHFRTVSLAEGIEYAADPAQGNADVISMSLGGICSDLWAEAVNYAYDEDVVMVAAAGNYTLFWVVHPAAFKRVIAVSATDHDDKPTSWSAFGPQIDVSAPGLDVPAAARGGGYDMIWWGTSAATPHVAGAAALVRGQNQELTNRDIRQILRDSSDDLGWPGFDWRYGYGRLNAYKALLRSGVKPADPYDPPPDVCPFLLDQILPAGPRQATFKAALDLLDQSPDTRPLAQLSERHTTQIAALLLANPELRRQLFALFDAAEPLAASLVEKGQQTAPSPQFVAQTEAFFRGLAAQANPDLQADLQQAWKALNAWGFEGQGAQSILPATR